MLFCLFMSFIYVAFTVQIDDKDDDDEKIPVKMPTCSVCLWATPSRWPLYFCTGNIHEQHVQYTDIASYNKNNRLVTRKMT